MNTTLKPESLKCKVMVTVYFEYKGHAEVVATFVDEDLYMICLPALEKEAKKNNLKVTESIG